MYNICSDEECVGCGLCAAVCPQKAIHMCRANGGMQPTIDDSMCINCGLCRDMCIGNKGCEKSESIYYAGWSVDDELVKNSSSGGVFGTLAKKVISDGGVIVGAYEASALEVKHILIDKASELPKLYGSKYIQSDISDIYGVLKEQLGKRKVLYVGTPCQIYAVKTYAERNRLNIDNLILVDLICHGVSTIEPLERCLTEHGFSADENTYINYRKKVRGWNRLFFSITSRITGNIYEKEFGDSDFGKVFNENLFLRESCYRCDRKTNHSAADITLGDFWGYTKSHHVNMNGTSLIFIHSKNGECLWNEIKNDMYYYPLSESEATKQRSSLYPAVCKHNRERAKNDLEKNGLHYVARKYCKVSFRRRVRWVLEAVLKKEF